MFVRYSYFELEALSHSPLIAGKECDLPDVLLNVKNHISLKSSGRRDSEGSKLRRSTRNTDDVVTFRSNDECFPSRPPGFTSKQAERLVDEEPIIYDNDDAGPVPEWASSSVTVEDEWVPSSNDLVSREKSMMKKKMDDEMRKEMLGYDPDVEDKTASSTLMSMLNVVKPAQPAPAPSGNKWDSQAFWDMNVPGATQPSGAGSRFDALFDEPKRESKFDFSRMDDVVSAMRYAQPVSQRFEQPAPPPQQQRVPLQPETFIPQPGQYRMQQYSQQQYAAPQQQQYVQQQPEQFRGPDPDLPRILARYKAIQKEKGVTQMRTVPQQQTPPPMMQQQPQHRQVWDGHEQIHVPIMYPPAPYQQPRMMRPYPQGRM